MGPCCLPVLQICSFLPKAAGDIKLLILIHLRYILSRCGQRRHVDMTRMERGRSECQEVATMTGATFFAPCVKASALRFLTRFHDRGMPLRDNARRLGR